MIGLSGHRGVHVAPAAANTPFQQDVDLATRYHVTDPLERNAIALSNDVLVREKLVRNFHFKFACALGTCYTWGNFHAVMLDGRISYSFRGECEYILAEECPRKPKPAFSVRQEMKLCHSVDQCSKEVRIFLGEKRTDYILSSNSVTAARSDRIRKLTLPHRNRGVNITNDGVFVTFRTDGLTVRYDRHSRVYVTIGQQYRNRTCGLCGNTTGTDDDDDIFRRNREMTASGTQY